MRLKLLTLNILHGGVYLEKVLSFLSQADADIICLQEVNSGGELSAPKNLKTVEALVRDFPDHNIAFDPALTIVYKEGEAQHGNCLLSKFPILSHEIIYFQSGYTQLKNPLPGPNPDYRIYPKHMQKSRLMVGNKELFVFNLHGVWDFHGLDTPERLHMSRVILEKLEGLKYVILAGDSNVRPNTETIHILESRLHSVFGNTLTTTFNLAKKVNPAIYRDASVDVIFCSKNISVIDSQCPQVDVSDHLPLTATFEL